jgi:tetratricopeptide (TPR) repeat protein
MKASRFTGVSTMTPVLHIRFRLSDLGIVAKELGDLAEARRCYERVIATTRARDDRSALAGALNNMGLVLTDQGDLDGAFGHFAESLALMREVGHKSYIANCIGAFASLALEQGEMTRAVCLFSAMSALRSQIGNPLPPHELKWVEGVLADAAQQLGQEAYALRWAEGSKLDWDQAMECALNPEGGS